VQQVLQRAVLLARPTAAGGQLALQRAQPETAARQQVLPEQVSALGKEQLREWQRALAQESGVSPRARLALELLASPLQAQDALLVALVRSAQAFSVQPWPPLPWLRGLLRRLPQHRRHPSNDDELFQQLRR
jgi:hypothetical protein